MGYSFRGNPSNGPEMAILYVYHHYLMKIFFSGYQNVPF
jgi:hypothetical protein